MTLLLKEIEANFNAFDGNWRKHMGEVSAELAKQKPRFLQSYRRIVSLQAWRGFLESRISSDSLSFFLEAQNDALTSHVFASLGSWRSSLKALRSCIENVIFCLYYKDHPVEYTLWEAGHHKPPIAELLAYLERHPRRVAQPTVDPLPHIQSEYVTLSNDQRCEDNPTLVGSECEPWSVANAGANCAVKPERSSPLSLQVRASGRRGQPVARGR